MSFAYWLFTFFVLGSFAALGACLQIFGLSRLPEVKVNWIVSTVLWCIIGVISCLFAWLCVWGGFGALISWIFEIGILFLVCFVAFKEFQGSSIWKWISVILGL